MSDILKPHNSLQTYRYNQHRSVNQYRTETFAQPRTLQGGDILSNGWIVKMQPYTDESGIAITFLDDTKRYMAPRLPLQLNGSTPSVLPEDLQFGDVLQTGCVVLDNPQPAQLSTRSDTQYDIPINLSGGQRPHIIAAPADLELARFGTLDDITDTEDFFAQLVIEKLSHLRKNILRTLGECAVIDVISH